MAAMTTSSASLMARSFVTRCMPLHHVTTGMTSSHFSNVMKTTVPQLKRDLLQRAHDKGRVQFTRVGKSMTDRVEARLRNAYFSIIDDEVQRHPSLGKTLK